MDKNNLIQLTSGTILKVIDDGGFMSGHGFQFVRISACAHMAVGTIKGVSVDISLHRLTGGKHGQ